ncbi:MAG TPA: hypothetical protein VES39_06500 [Rhodospirillales bacterium]|nr:hypothetical protein [Rhodospirillales bacterium]
MKLERIDARDVLDANAKTAESFPARIVGRFVRSGPNAWDDYVFAPAAADAQGTITVMAEVPVQVEADGAHFRMRLHGAVVRLEWLPADPDAAPPADRRSRFLSECVRSWGESPGRGAAAVIAEKLTSAPPKASLD